MSNLHNALHAIIELPQMLKCMAETLLMEWLIQLTT
jgi:hypothetical protein